ncbi:hypothetical protein ADUPG1_010201 [Aduncisulcus paluster]|uniref:FERM domain-containing protein n=1 Tax=Aduncisulcus paluster TaxID=2918883 RepID=A0ABQ5JUL2_9EUKA|nr:hypothetical protein ADUPG1_010201 [Aduncisulcus paluster]|eukprot:gnl/Carplike_NY0171/505_a691_2172.p1 GENE.gnl/Carplike_NY0171/505_a691_2172~~gnl/Carplike_NY0171/505_a691_2172.p1  ORF type:complete len:317 (-),score=78.26 gnl/Carplike_NY0171/505_a691_2172:116-1066(-)
MSDRQMACVYFLDGSRKTVQIDDKTTGSQLADMIADKIELQTNDNQFCIFEEGQDFSRPLTAIDEEATIADTMAKWTGHERFVYKRVFFMDDKEDYTIDPVLKHLMFSQFKDNVLKGIYALPEDQIGQLAGLCFQATYGDHDERKHKPGFLGKHIAEYIPATKRSSKKSAYWEQLIFRNHRELVGVTPSDCETQYIQKIATLPYHRYALFDAKYLSEADKSIGKRCWIGVAAKGIHLLDHHTMNPLDDHSFFHLHEILTWGHTDRTFAMSMPSGKGDEPEDQVRHLFETKCGSQIVTLLYGYVKLYLAEMEPPEAE